MSRRETQRGRAEDRRPPAAEGAVADWRIVVFAAGDADTEGGGGSPAASEFWAVARGLFEQHGYQLDLLDGGQDTGAHDGDGSTWPYFGHVPRSSTNGPHPVRVRLRKLQPAANGSTGSAGATDAPFRHVGVVICSDSRDRPAADAVASAFEGLGFPCVRADSIPGAAEALIDRVVAQKPPLTGLMETAAATETLPTTDAPAYSPWRPVLLVPLIALLVAHSINPWLRGELRSRFQFPGFSYDFLNFESVPLVAPLVVGLPTLVAYIVIRQLWRWTKVAPPRWACWALLIPAGTTVYFAARFFIEGRIVSTHSQVVHSQGIGMLVETIGMFESVDDDHFRYRQPGGVNYSHTIQPFWEPWAILVVAFAVAAFALSSLFSCERTLWWKRRA